jgi:hypothetical protein
VTTEGSIDEQGLKISATEPLPTSGESNGPNADATSALDKATTKAAQESDSSALHYVTRNQLQTTEGDKAFSSTIAAAITSSPVNKESKSNATTSEKTPGDEKNNVNQSSTVYDSTLSKAAQILTNAISNPSKQMSETTPISTTIATSTSSTSTVAPPTTTTLITTTSTTTTSTTTTTTSTTTTTTTTVIMEFLAMLFMIAK